MIGKKFLIIIALIIIVLICAVYFGVINPSSLEILSHGDGVGSSPPNFIP